MRRERAAHVWHKDEPAALVERHGQLTLLGVGVAASAAFLFELERAAQPLHLVLNDLLNALPHIRLAWLKPDCQEQFCLILWAVRKLLADDGAGDAAAEDDDAPGAAPAAAWLGEKERCTPFSAVN